MRYALVLVLAALAGCSAIPQYEAAKPVVIDKASQANDEALVDAMLVICRGVSVGAWQRAFGNSPERAAAWRTLCKVDITQTP
jgi:hypothetical protein